MAKARWPARLARSTDSPELRVALPMTADGDFTDEHVAARGHRSSRSSSFVERHEGCIALLSTPSRLAESAALDIEQYRLESLQQELNRRLLRQVANMGLVRGSEVYDVAAGFVQLSGGPHRVVNVGQPRSQGVRHRSDRVLRRRDVRPAMQPRAERARPRRSAARVRLTSLPPREGTRRGRGPPLPDRSLAGGFGSLAGQPSVGERGGSTPSGFRRVAAQATARRDGRRRAAPPDPWERRLRPAGALVVADQGSRSVSGGG